MTLGLDPKDWFLADRGNPDTQVSLFTTGNQVKCLVDGQEYMQGLNDLLNSAGAGDYFYYVGLELNLDIRLVHGDSQSAIGKVLKRARQRKVDIRVMLSGNVGHANTPTYKTLRGAPYPIECILDCRFRFATIGTAHQKFALLLTDKAEGPAAERLAAKELHAWCGGIDVTIDRWDDEHHTRQPKRQYKDFPAGWHDVHTFIRGPACRDLHIAFRERWNNPERPQWDETNYTPISTAIPASAVPVAGKHFVQVLRTFPCGYLSTRRVVAAGALSAVGATLFGLIELARSNVTYPFATKGEFSAGKACLKAIHQAQDLIYIEDQYFYSSEIASALCDELLAKPELRVIVLVAREPIADKTPEVQNYYHARTLDLVHKRLKGTAGEDHFAIYDIGNKGVDPEQIYVHAKLMIVDDIWVEIGSMNCNRRSMTHDLESCVAVVDGDTVPVTYGTYREACKFARDLRLRLWADHLGTVPSDPQIENPQVGFATWMETASSEAFQVRFHSAAKDRDDGILVWRTLNVVDPQGTCSGVPPIPDP